MKYEYFLVLGLTLIVPLLKSFNKELNFFQSKKRFLFSMIIPFLIFVLIDIIAVKRNLWFFNDNFTVGFKIFNLPVEEILFFVVIPFSCLFLWETVKFLSKKWSKQL